jgi:hypothetical protein
VNDTAASGAPQLRAIEGHGDKPRWAPAWAPSAATLDYVTKLLSLILLLLGVLYFAGLDGLKPFAQRHVAAV